MTFLRHSLGKPPIPDLTEHLHFKPSNRSKQESMNDYVVRKTELYGCACHEENSSGLCFQLSEDKLVVRRTSVEHSEFLPNLGLVPTGRVVAAVLGGRDGRGANSP